MFKFNISEEIIFNIKNGSFRNKLFGCSESYLFDKFLNKIRNENVLIVYGFDNKIREEICIEVIYRFFYGNENLDLSVFKISCMDELDEIYLDDKAQIFYLNDFFGKIDFKLLKFKSYLDRIINSKNKFLIVNIRDFTKDKISNFALCENLNDYRNDILNILGSNLKEVTNTFEDVYSRFFYMDKFILFSVVINNLNHIDMWFKITKNYFLGKHILRENKDFNESILESFKKLEDEFISICEDGSFCIKNLVVEDFLLSKLKNELNIVKDLFNNISCYSNLKNFVGILKKLNIKVSYTQEEYESNLKCNLFEIICSNNIKDVIGLLKFSLELFDIIGVRDFSIIDNLNIRIIYSNVNMDNAINYFCVIRDFKEILIENEIFKNKLFNLMYSYNSLRDFEFYNYNFKYFLFVSEFYNLYDTIDDEEFLDIKKYFDRLVNIILNNINSYFNLEYFSLSSEIKQALIDLKVLIEKFNVKFIFLENVEELFNNVKYKFNELFNNVINFVPQNNQEYYTLIYFENELDRNKDFIEYTFENINLEWIFEEIKKNICKFKA